MLRGPANIEVTLPVTYDSATGQEVKKTLIVPALKGQLLRNVLLDAGMNLYDMKGKATNCGGAGQCATCVVTRLLSEIHELSCC